MGFCDVPVLSSVCDTAGEAAASLISAPFEWLAAGMGAAAEWMFESVWQIFDTTTMVDVTSGEYVEVYNLIFGMAIFVMLIFFCLQLITGMIRREPGALSRAAFGLAKSVLGSFVVLTLTGLLLEIVDQLCTGIIQAAGETTESMGAKITGLVAALATLNLTAPGVGAIITIFLGGLAISAAAIVWLSLLIRKALLLVAVVLAPFAFSGASWDVSRGWIGKWAGFVLALILSKLVLVIILLVAVTQVSAPIDGDLASVADPLAGIVLMALAGFAPYLTYRFLSFIGGDLYNSMGSEQEAKSALNRPLPTPGKQQGNSPSKVLDDKGSKDGSGGGGKKSGSSSDPSPKPGPSGNTGGGTGGSTASGSTGAGTAGSAGAGGAGAGAGAGAAAAGPAAAVVAGAAVAKKAATAGPEAGQALAGQAETATDGAEQPGQESTTSKPAPANTPAPQAGPVTSPLPKTPPDTPSPKPSAPRQDPKPSGRTGGKE
ncbi:conjugal transfer protein TrbL [Brevibacterium sp. XM4083]|uniref:conjugal transfer protein TrbL n=1 Tax=Brevibacterium sp. XM4083 TaxID=2583238 RepID=UPI00112C7F8F|nr:conjugal transfer protein TrbL [Brevibacterium sp. XM4083]MCM1011781.1 conjugal transfer protein TrbL [Brevibacterium sp. XM4083]